MSSGEFSGSSSDAALDAVTGENLGIPSAQPLLGALNHDFGRADGPSHAAVKPTRIRLRVNLTPMGPPETKIILRLKRPKLGKGASKKGKKP